MTLAALLVEERTRSGVTIETLSTTLGVPLEDLRALEADAGSAEAWGARLADLAIALGVPMSRFIAESGKAADHRNGDCGRLTRQWREARGLSLEQLAAASGVASERLLELETGTSDAEHWLPLLLGVAQAIDQPLFNFFYPFGVPLRELEAYA